MTVKSKIKESPGDRALLTALYIICVILFVITLYPFVYVLSMSISDKRYVLDNSVWLYPKGFSLEVYKMIFSNSDIWTSYYNSVWYAVVGTAINVVCTLLCAYALSRRKFFLRNQLTFFITFTMFFNGGIIPFFVLIQMLGMYNTRWAMIIPGAIQVYYLLIARQFLQNIPESMHESATIDGAGEFRILTRIFLPLSTPIIAVLILFHAVGHWNSYMPALLYLPNKELQPLQILLARIVLQNSTEALKDLPGGMDRGTYFIQIRYAVIIAVILPIICIYPFVQKYFVQGVMIGAIKE